MAVGGEKSTGYLKNPRLVKGKIDQNLVFSRVLMFFDP